MRFQFLAWGFIILAANESLVGRGLSVGVLWLFQGHDFLWGYLHRAYRMILRLIEDSSIVSINVWQNFICSFLSYLLDGVKEASVLPSVANVLGAAILSRDRHWLWDEIWVASFLIVTKFASPRLFRRFDTELWQLARPSVCLQSVPFCEGRVYQIL